MQPKPLANSWHAPCIVRPVTKEAAAAGEEQGEKWVLTVFKVCKEREHLHKF